MSVDAARVLASDDALVECGDLPAVQDIFVVRHRRGFEDLNRLVLHFPIGADLDVQGFLGSTDGIDADDVLGIDDVALPPIIGREGSDHASGSLEADTVSGCDLGSDTVGAMIPFKSFLQFASSGECEHSENVTGSDGREAASGDV